MSTLRALNSSIENDTRTRDFVVVCRALAAGEGDALAAVGVATRLAGSGLATEMPAALLRSAVAAGGLEVAGLVETAFRFR